MVLTATVMPTRDYRRETIGIRFPYEERYEQEGPTGIELVAPLYGFCSQTSSVLIPASIKTEPYPGWVHVPANPWVFDAFRCHAHGDYCKLRLRQLWAARAEAYKNVLPDDFEQVERIVEAGLTPAVLRVPHWATEDLAHFVTINP